MGPGSSQCPHNSDTVTERTSPGSMAEYEAQINCTVWNPIGLSLVSPNSLGSSDRSALHLLCCSANIIADHCMGDGLAIMKKGNQEGSVE